MLGSVLFVPHDHVFILFVVFSSFWNFKMWIVKSTPCCNMRTYIYSAMNSMNIYATVNNRTECTSEQLLNLRLFLWWTLVDNVRTGNDESCMYFLSVNAMWYREGVEIRRSCERLEVTPMHTFTSSTVSSLEDETFSTEIRTSFTDFLQQLRNFVQFLYFQFYPVNVDHSPSVTLELLECSLWSYTRATVLPMLHKSTNTKNDR